MAKLREELVEGRMMFLAERNHVLTWITTPAAVIAAVAAVVAAVIAA